MLQAFQQEAGLKECAVLSTCNRTEIYGACPYLNGQPTDMKRILSQMCEVSFSSVEPHWYVRSFPDCVSHLFRVASGLDSMVVGENEILGQVKEAYEMARLEGATGKILNRLFEKAIHAAKEVRARTGIGRGKASIGSCAVEAAVKIFGGAFSEKTVMIIGAGKMGELTARYFFEKGAHSIFVANRSFERAEELADSFGGEAVRFEALPRMLEQADIVITSTRSPHRMIEKGDIAPIMRRRKNRPLFFIDISVPRNINASVSELENVYLYNIDDFNEGLQTGHRERADCVEACEAILSEKADRFCRWFKKEGEASREFLF
ncbi:MAG: glutamyl-tRNA reductase [Omnitrophica WOR_2 bacterium RIFCSPHIGHO2_02_FULL_52_10]|nr:MAG: glutamyl-tRNA reductase [Omnitrophica WOR_2 bacterium RIFCSPHIGHO2_02_FULL_52_10]